MAENRYSMPVPMATHRDSLLMSRSKRTSQSQSQYLIPYSVVDFNRDSWIGDRRRHMQPPPSPMRSPAGQGNGKGEPWPLARPESSDSFDAGSDIEKKGIERGEKEKEGEEEDQILGSTEIYDKDGNIRLIPTPTPDPRDPLNLPEWRKWLAIGSLCLFGSVSLAAEIAIGGLLPVFLLEYSGVADPAGVLKHADLSHNPDPLGVVPAGITPIPLAQVSLLATIPMLSNGFATYLLVPLSTAVGRRPVLILTSTLSWAGGFWAGYSTSLQQHIAARVLHGLGSGAVEALLPLIVQDMVFIHQRNRAIATIIASQGPMITALGILGPYVAANYDWRWLYWGTSAVGVVAWLLLLLLVPETHQRQRSAEELSGRRLWPVAAGENRTALDYATYGPRSRWDDLGFFQYPSHWKAAGVQVVDTLRTALFPAVAWCVLLQTVFGIVTGASQQAVSFALLAAGVPFELTGLSNIPSILGTAVVFVLGGPVADKITLLISRRRGGAREPEYHLANLVLPVVLAIAGMLVFGAADQFALHYTVLLTGTFLILTATLTAAPTINNYVIESYPQWAGPVLVNVSTLRVFTSFFFTTQVTTWISQLGPLRFMEYLSLVLLVVSAGIPLLFLYGKPVRKWTSARVVAKKVATKRARDEKGEKGGEENGEKMANPDIQVSHHA